MNNFQMPIVPHYIPQSQQFWGNQYLQRLANQNCYLNQQLEMTKMNLLILQNSQYYLYQKQEKDTQDLNTQFQIKNLKTQQNEQELIKIKEEQQEEHEDLETESTVEEKLSKVLKLLLIHEDPNQSFYNLPPQFIDCLFNKLQSKKHTREEMIKYILRRAFNFMEDKIMKENGLTLKSKEARQLFVKKYCLSEQTNVQMKGKKKHQIEKSLNIFMPFRKNSKIRTMNNQYLETIFSQPKFVEDFDTFIEQFDDIAIKMNQKKIQCTVPKLAKMLKTKNYTKINKLKGLPWLNGHIHMTKQLALVLKDIGNF